MICLVFFQPHADAEQAHRAPAAPPGGVEQCMALRRVDHGAHAFGSGAAEIVEADLDEQVADRTLRFYREYFQPDRTV